MRGLRVLRGISGLRGVQAIRGMIGVRGIRGIRGIGVYCKGIRGYSMKSVENRSPNIVA